MNKWRSGVLVAFAVALLAGCAGKPTRTMTPEEIVQANASHRWNALLSQDWPGAYKFLTKGYRQVIPLETFSANASARNIRWKGAKVTDVRCDEPERCVAFVVVDYALVGGVPGIPDMSSSQLLRENWLRDGDGWYYLPRRAGR